jgi:hypothetical protein
MEVRQRRRAAGPSASSSLAPSDMYSAENNYGFNNKSNKRALEEAPAKDFEGGKGGKGGGAEEQAQHRAQAVSRPGAGGGGYADDDEIQYPDNIGTFADGLKGDIFELFETGAKVLNKSFKLLLPFGSESGAATSDVMRDIEIRSPLANISNKTKYRSSQQGGGAAGAASMSSAKSPFKAAEDAIRMRCSSMWKKEQSMNSAAEPFLPMPNKNLFPGPGPPAGGSNIRVKEGVKVQLNKLNSGNGSIQVTFPFV